MSRKRIADFGIQSGDWPPAGAAAACWRSALVGLFVCLFMPLAHTDPVFAGETEAERIARLETMTAEEQRELQRKREQFEDLEEPGRNKLRELHASIEAAPNAPQLQETLARYTAWLNTLSSIQRAQLSADPEQRIKDIKELMRQQEIARFRSFVESDLPEDDRDKIYQWVVAYVKEHRQEIESRMPRDDRWRLKETKDEAGRLKHLAFWLQFQLRDPNRKLPPELMAEHLPDLSAEATAQLDQAQTPEERQKRVEDLIRAAILSQVIPRASEEELRKFYADLPIEARSRLEGLEGDELKSELRKMYNFTRFHRGGPGGWGSGRGPGGPGGRRDDDDDRRGDGRRGEGPPRVKGPPRGDDRQDEDRNDEGRSGDDRPNGSDRPSAPTPSAESDQD